MWVMCLRVRILFLWTELSLKKAQEQFKLVINKCENGHSSKGLEAFAVIIVLCFKIAILCYGKFIALLTRM